jgi:hypothetical protein
MMQETTISESISKANCLEAVIHLLTANDKLAEDFVQSVGYEDWPTVIISMAKDFHTYLYGPSAEVSTDAFREVATE